ncbi:MAG: ribonuclease HII, partial [Ferruginibacter sp.]
THRDEYMQMLHKEFSYYAWNTNKGYGTAEHRKAIDEKGICKYHRKTFNIFSPQIALFQKVI